MCNLFLSVSNFCYRLGLLLSLDNLLDLNLHLMFSFFGFLRCNRPSFFSDLYQFAAPPVVSVSLPFRLGSCTLLSVLFCLLLAVLFCLLLAMLFCLLLAMLFCLFVPLSEVLVDLLLVVVEVLRLCAPFRQSGFASFVDFFSSLALLAVMLSLFSVFWCRFLQLYLLVVVYCSEVRLLHLQCQSSTCVTS